MYSYNYLVSLGLIDGVEEIQIVGHVEELTADVVTDISELGIPVIPLPDNAGEVLEIVSDNPADTDIIEIKALGPNGVLIQPFEIVLTGTTPVVLPLISRINGARSVGVDGFAGTISIKQNGGATVFCKLLATHQRSIRCVYSVHNTAKAIFRKLTSTIHKTGGVTTEVEIEILIKRFDQVKWTLADNFGLQKDGTTADDFNSLYPEQITGPYDVKVRALTNVTGASPTAKLSGLLFHS